MSKMLTKGARCALSPIQKTATIQLRHHASSSAARTVQTLDYKSTISISQNSTIFSLIQPTNKFHIGNYLGTIKIWRDLANNPQVAATNSTLIFGIADLHALTKPRDAAAFRAARLEAVASIVASGVDPTKAVIFNQSAIPEHSELYWILCCQAGMGHLNRMTQWKSKTAGVASGASVFDSDVLSKTNAGIFMYPVLQAADILLYKSTLVPVGDDQVQHLELCREIAGKFNKFYGTKKGFRFPEPRTILAPTKKVLSLRDPGKKMSKSDADQDSAIYITEEPETITRKIKRAVTDSKPQIFFDPVNRPGVSNLINIVSGLKNTEVSAVEAELKQQGITDHKKLKDYVGETLIENLKACKAEYERLTNDKGYLDQIIARGNEQARSIAVENMNEIKKAVGLL